MNAEPDYRTHVEHGLMQGFPPAPDKVVTAENGLWVPPFNRWAYQHMRELVPSVSITSVATPQPLPRTPRPALDEVTVPRPDGSTASFDEFLRTTYTDAMVVVHDGVVVQERYDNSMTPHTPHQMMSCTKSFIGLFAMAAAREGHVAETDRVGDLLPELEASGFADATLGHLLDMTNSLMFDETYDDPEADIHAYAAIVGIGEGSRQGGPGNLFEYLATLRGDPAAAHGAVFHYQTPKTDVVNWATNRVTGRSLFADFDRLWAEMGGTDEAYVLVDPVGAPVAGGGLNASPEDLARFALSMLAGDSLVAPPAVLDLIQGGGSVDAFLAGPDAIGMMADGNWTYRAQWWVRNEPGREAMTAIGVNGQWIYLDRARDVAIIKQSSQPVALDEWADDFTIAAFDRIIDALG